MKFSLYQHLFPAAVWRVVTRSPASGCFKCHYSSHLSSDLVVFDGFRDTTTDLQNGFRIFCLYKGFCHRTESDLLLFLLL